MGAKCGWLETYRFIENTVGQFFNKVNICANAAHDFVDSLQSLIITPVVATFDHIGVLRIIRELLRDALDSRHRVIIRKHSPG